MGVLPAITPDHLAIFRTFPHPRRSTHHTSCPISTEISHRPAPFPRSHDPRWLAIIAATCTDITRATRRLYELCTSISTSTSIRTTRHPYGLYTSVAATLALAYNLPPSSSIDRGFGYDLTHPPPPPPSATQPSPSARSSENDLTAWLQPTTTRSIVHWKRSTKKKRIHRLEIRKPHFN